MKPPPRFLFSFFFTTAIISDSEILASEGLTELPAGRDHVPRGGAAAVAGGDAEGEGLAHQDGVGLPVLPPVPAHAHPPCPRPLHAHPHDVPRARDVADEHQVEVAVAVDCEPYPSLFPAWHPAEIKRKSRGQIGHFRNYKKTRFLIA